MKPVIELDPDVDDEAPTGDNITAYDEQHHVTYLRLRDADAYGANWTEVGGSCHIVTPHPMWRGRGAAGKVILPAQNG